MADLPESATYPAGIYQLEQTDPVVGGPPNLATGEGMSNVQAQQLADRTNWLKTELLSRTAASALLASIKTVDGSGSGLDADLLDGLNATTAANGDTIARRDAQGDLAVRYVQTTQGTESSIASGATVAMRINGSSDNFVRMITAAGFVAWLNANNGGLNADKIDGLHGSQLLRSDETGSIDGNLTIEGGNLNIEAPSASGSSHVFFYDDAARRRGALYWSRASDVMRLHRYAADGTTIQGYFEIEADGRITANGQTVWHAGNDGSGSGLDADLLDGRDSSKFLRSDVSDQKDGRLTLYDTQNNGEATLSLEAFEPSILFEDLSTNASDFQIHLNSGAFTIRHGDAEVGDELPNEIFKLTDTGFAYINGNYIWHAGNDGFGSGLDADKLDGLDASSFMRSDAYAFTTGSLGVDGGVIYLDGQSNSNPQMYFRDENNSSHGLLFWNRGADSIELLRYDTPGSIEGKISIGNDGVVRINNHTAWHAGNDGPGSGSNADVLDGLQSWQFLRSDVDDQLNGRLLITETSAASDEPLLRLQSYRPNIVLEDLSTDQIDFQLHADQGVFTIRQGDASAVDKLATEALKIANGVFRFYGSSVWHDGDAGRSLGTSGYQKLPSGLIVQWRAGSNANNAALTFPIAFPSTCFGVVFGDQNNPNTEIHADILSYANLSRTGFTFRAYNGNGTPSSGGTDYFFIALGI